jgi:hypothetical protein
MLLYKQNQDLLFFLMRVNKYVSILNINRTECLRVQATNTINIWKQKAKQREREDKTTLWPELEPELQLHAFGLWHWITVNKLRIWISLYNVFHTVYWGSRCFPGVTVVTSCGRTVPIHKHLSMFSVCKRWRAVPVTTDTLTAWYSHCTLTLSRWERKICTDPLLKHGLRHIDR